MSESQTKAGNQRKFENLKIFENLKNLKFKIAQVDPRDMLNKFCFHLNAENSLFIAENCNGIFRDILTLSCYIRCHRAGSQLKMIFTSPSLVLT